MGRRSAEHVRTLSFARTMHHEATEPFSVTTHGQVRECKRSSAPGEGPEEVLSDRSSTLLASTMIKGSPLVGGPFVINARGVELRVIPERFRRPAAGASGDTRALFMLKKASP